MSFMKKLFGGGGGNNAAPGPSGPGNPGAAARTINTIQNLADHEESLEKRKALVEKRIEAEAEKVREFLKQNKKAQASQCLKKQKLLEQEVINLDNMIMRVVEQRIMLEGQRQQAEVVATMGQAAQTAKSNMKEMNVDNVDKVLEDINEANDMMKQVNEAFANPVGLAADIDDDDIMNELAEIQQAELDKQLLEPASVPTTKVTQGAAEKPLPSVPQKTAAPSAAKTKEELELDALQAEMAL